MTSRHETLVDVPLDRVVTGKQPRTQFSKKEIESLAATFLAKGILNRLRVFAQGENYSLLAGERRFRAAKLLAEKGITEFQTVPCILVEGELSAVDEFEEKLIDNLHRQDLDPIDEGNGYSELMAQREMDSQSLARHIHIPHQRIRDALALLTLPDDLQGHVRSGVLPKASAVEIAKLDDSNEQREIARLSMEEGETARTIKAVVARRRGARRKPKPGRNRSVFKVGEGRSVIVRSKGVIPSTGILDAIHKAAKQVHREVMADTGDTTLPPSISWGTLRELMQAFADPTFEFALVGLIRKVGPILITELLQLLDNTDGTVRKSAEVAFNGLTRETKLAVAHFRPRK